MPKIITLMPTRGLIFTKAQQALEEELLKNNQVPYILRTDNQPIPDCRNTLVEQALKTPATHFLLMDDDVIMPEGGLKAMIDLDTDIAFIDYPMHYTGDKWGEMGTATFDEYLPGDDTDGKPVAWAGLGCTLVKREVFENLPSPWFQVFQKSFTRDENGHITINDDELSFGGGGEDVYFMLEAKKKGYKVEIVHGMAAGHARLVRPVLALQEDKYKVQHEIRVNSFIKQQYR